MIIRNFESSDVPQLKEIHQQYKDEFPIEEFKDNYRAFFTVADDSGKVIIFGGVRLIPEVVIMTNKTHSPKTRIKALKLFYQAISWISAKNGLRYLHAFVQDKTWERQLIKYGFRSTKGKALVIDL